MSPIDPFQLARSRSALLAGATLALLLAGCSSPPTQDSLQAGVQADAMHPDRGASGSTRWFEVIETDLSGGARRESRAGLIEERTRNGELLYLVRDAKDREVGYILEDFQTFRFKKEFGPDGSATETSEHLGNLSLRGGVRRILGLSEEVEIRPITGVATSEASS